MNTTLLDRLKGFQIPPTTPFAKGQFVVARLQGVDFEGLLASPDFSFTRPFDAQFGKMMVRTAGHLLGGEACGRFGFTEHFEVSLLLDPRTLADQWADASDLQSFLVAIASSKMSLQLEDEALFTCKLYSFAKPDLVVAYFMWRRQEAALQALDLYCKYLLGKEGQTPAHVATILEGLGPLEKEEILLQNRIEYAQLPAWQRWGSGVYLSPEGKVTVETNLPQDAAYGAFLQPHLAL
jgi:tRNA(His) guanylyltransferase